MIPLSLVASQTDFNVTETHMSLGLSKQQHEQLLPACKSLRVLVSLMLIDTFFELVLTNELH